MNWQGDERRRFIRAQFPCKITVADPQRYELNTVTENIGRGGLRLIINRALNVSSLVDLEIYLCEEPISCRGRVVWTIGKDNVQGKMVPLFDTGVEFYNMEEQDLRFIEGLMQMLLPQEPF